MPGPGGQVSRRLAGGGPGLNQQHVRHPAFQLLPDRRAGEIYGYQYPIQYAPAAPCYPGYLYWNGYIPSNLINSHNAAGQPNGYEGIPSNYQPAVAPPGRLRRRLQRSDAEPA